MKKFFLSLLLAAACTSLCAADLIIAEKGKSSYKIVYADQELYPHHNRYSNIAANTLQKLFRHAAGAVLPAVPESQFDGKGKAIFLGSTKAVRKAGLTPAKYGIWEHRIDVKDGNIYLHGMDWRNKRDPKVVYRQMMVLGSYKAMLTFAEKFLNAVFAGTPDFCDGVPKTDKVTIPDNYRWKRTPRIEYNLSGRRGLEYDLANNGFYAPWYGCYGGHNHNVAVPPAKYFKSNPEYYAVNKGKRDPGPRVQLCLSNKNVQELIYKEVLDHLDKGYDMVQLAQSDGFTPCECLNCQNLFGLRPDAKPTDKQAYRSSYVWGEKLWILHRNFAQRLLKDRPGKKVCVIAYGPTRKPPVTFKEFPSNVVIELAPYSEEILKSWKPYKVPGGFVVYLYNWGYYNFEGFMPKRSWNFLKAQVQSLLKSNVKGIYCCGFGENLGLEGANYYIWLKLTEDPDQDVKKLLKRYCGNLYPKAAKEMEEFYTLLNSRLDLQYETKEVDWNDPALLNGTFISYDRASVGTIRLRWTEEVMQKLDSLLKTAEAKSGKNWLLSLARWELDYLMITARSVNALGKFRTTLSDADYKVMEKYMIQRQEFIDSAKWNKKGQAHKDGYPLFANAQKPAVLAGGRLRGVLNAPFNWDMRWYKSKGVKLAGRTIKANDPNPQYLVVGNFLTDMGEHHKKRSLRLFCRNEGDNLKVVFIRTGMTSKDIPANQVSVFLGPDKANLSRFIARFRNGKLTRYVKRIDNVANKGQGDVYGNGSNAGTVKSPAPGVKLAPGEISVELTIPYSLFGKKPAPGDEWLFNATGDFTFPHVSYYTVWEYNFEQVTWRNPRDNQGRIKV